MEYPGDVASICKTYKTTELVQPEPITSDEYNSNIAKRMIFESDMKEYMKRKKHVDKNLRAIYSIVWGQCSPMMQSKLEAKDEYEEKSNKCDCVWVLKEIKAITHQFEETTIKYVSLFDAWKAFYTFRQETDQSLHEYLKEYQALVQVLEHYQAPIGEGTVYEDLETDRIKFLNKNAGDDIVAKKAKTAAKQRFTAISFLQCADRKRYGGLWSELKNQFTRGLDQYPRDLTGAYNLLLNYAPHHHAQQKQNQKQAGQPEEVSAMTFLQDEGGAIAGTDGITRPKIQCYNCQGHGHYADVCPNEENVEHGTQHLQVGPDEKDKEEETATHNDAEEEQESTNDAGSEEDSGAEDDESDYESEFTFLTAGTIDYAMQQSAHDIPDTWVLLDSQSTVSVFKNRRYLSNKKQSKKILKV